MTAGHIALLVSLWIALAVVVSMVFGAIARSMGNDHAAPATPVNTHALGHRAAQWVSCILLAGALTMVALEQWA